MTSCSRQLLQSVSTLLAITLAHGLNMGGGNTPPINNAMLQDAANLVMSRRDVALTGLTGGSSILLGGTTDETTLSKRLFQKDPSLLPNKLFNLPPAAQVYPKWLRGTWNVDTTTFAGFLFPSQKIPKQEIVSNPTIAGFQKLSIVNLPDIGSDIPPYKFSIDAITGLEDRGNTFRSLIDTALKYKAVQTVSYNPSKNPNRISIDFVAYKTTNAERIELFCNARESNESSPALFCCAEYVRQVTFGTGNQVGVPRQVSTNYANFYTYQRKDDGTVVGNLLTAAYLDPQDPLYFQEPSKPVVVYSHSFRMNKAEG